ncbi:MAG TPA: hypothetical protein VL360_06245 [Gammaproteobacteria bacterium]|jgi:hypothetical protein|nr:hypothetical protein [Gammaproteobacteria bacterium]
MFRKTGNGLRKSKKSSSLWDNWEDSNNSQETNELQNILDNFQKPLPLPTEEILKSCIAFARLKDDMISVGEKYLHATAVLNFFDGLFAESAQAAGILGDAYFIDSSAAARSKSNYFNKMAAKAYALSGDVDRACHYYNQFLARAKSIDSYNADDVREAMNYLLDNHNLVCTAYLLKLLQSIIDNNEKCSYEFRRLYSRAEDNTIYESLSQKQAQLNLIDAVRVLRIQLAELIANNKTLSASSDVDIPTDLSTNTSRP